MVGVVIVSHSEDLAKSLVELTKMMAPTAVTAAAGGLPDGSFGTSFERIDEAIKSVYSDDGVLVFMDTGSSVMTTKMVLEMIPEMKVEMADCPLVEGAMIATFEAANGMTMEEIKEELKDVVTTPKFR